MFFGSGTYCTVLFRDLHPGQLPILPNESTSPGDTDEVFKTEFYDGSLKLYAKKTQTHKIRLLCFNIQ